MTRRIISALVALSVYAVVPAVAQAAPELTHPTGTTLSVGSQLMATNIGETTFTTSSGNIHCSTTQMTGTVKKNTGTEFQWEVSSAFFAGSDAEGDCTSGLGAVKVTPNLATNGLPWCIRNTKTPHQFELRGGACGSPLRPLRTILDFTPFGSCEYERATGLLGTFNTHPSDAVFTLPSSEMTKIGGGFFCPTGIVRDMSFTLETDVVGGGAVYIS
jgi:hypothetical protein